MEDILFHNNILILLKLFFTELQRMWLHLEHSCSYGKLCFTHWEQLFSFGHSGRLVCSCVINNQTFTLRTLSSSTFGCSPYGSTTVNQVSPSNPLHPLFPHSPHVLFNSIHKSRLCHFLGLSSFSFKKENCTWHNVTGIQSLKYKFISVHMKWILYWKYAEPLNEIIVSKNDFVQKTGVFFQW